MIYFPYQILLNSKEVFKKYITGEFKKEGLSIEKDALELILNLFNGHPFYTQLICQKIYLLAKAEKNVIEILDVNNALQSILCDERPYFEHMWEQLKSRKHFVEIIKFLVQEDRNPYKYSKLDRQMIYFVISELDKIGFVKKTEKSRYELTDPFFPDL